MDQIQCLSTCYSIRWLCASALSLLLTMLFNSSSDLSNSHSYFYLIRLCSFCASFYQLYDLRWNKKTYIKSNRSMYGQPLDSLTRLWIPFQLRSHFFLLFIFVAFVSSIVLIRTKSFFFVWVVVFLSFHFAFGFALEFYRLLEAESFLMDS